MVSYPLIITIYLWIFLLLHAYSDSKENVIDPLCDCYSVALESISETISSHDDDNDEANYNLQPICYTYSIQKNQHCQYDIISVIFGICNNDHEQSDFTQFTLNTLQESIISIHPNEQYVSEPYISSTNDDDPFLGLKLESIESSTWSDDQITLCLLNTNQKGITSHNVQFILETNDIITCQNQPNLNGLPCAHFQAKDTEQNPPETISESTPTIQQETVNLDYTEEPTLIPTSHPTQLPTQSLIDNNAENTHSSSPPNRDDRLDQVMEGSEDETELKQETSSSPPPMIAIIDNKPEKENTNKIMNQESDLIEPKQKGLSVTTRQYIRFAFILIMVFIGLNALCCILLALRQSGALDKYFDDVQEEDMNDTDEDEDHDEDDIYATDDEQEEFEDDTDDEDEKEDEDDIDIEDSPPVPHSLQNSIADHIKFGDLVAITRSDDDGDKSNKGAFKIYISQLDNQHHVDSPFKE